jgi:hypothetical protein
MTELLDEAILTSTRPRQRFESKSSDDVDLPLLLELVVEDRDVIRALVEYPEGPERNQYALEALKIGVLALRHVGGQVSADLIQRESARLVKDMQQTLNQHMQLVHGRLGDALKEYFDPESGRFNERVQRLVGQDGELSQLIKGFIDGENSQLARTMVTQIGPLMKHLDPQQSEGLLAVLRGTVETQLNEHRDYVLKEFSLDHKDGALCRLVTELTNKHGDLGKDLQKKIDEVIKEFSLNEENSALSRLVQNVTQAQRTITNEFSLDSDTSCLSRLKRELMTILEAHVKTNAEFQSEVKCALRELTARREEQARSTLHGGTFQSAVFEFLHGQTQQQGDICDFTADRVGAIKNCKIGDIVVELGPDTSAAGVKIVFEAKEERVYTLAMALAEIEKARKNRHAQVGVFVFSKKTAPKDLRSLRRFGDDIVVVWDAEDAYTDSFILAALESARLMCLCHQRRLNSDAADFVGIEAAMLDVEKRAGNLDKIGKYARTIQTAGGKILKRAQIDRKALDKQVALLRQKVADLRGATEIEE